METENHVFHVSSYDTEKLLPQVRDALEKRTEVASRVRYPGIWKVTDKVNSIPRGQPRSPLRRKIMSVICLAAGVLLFVPGLMKPQELTVPLLVGAVSIGAGIGGLLRGRIKRKDPFDRPARLLLAGKEEIAPDPALTVSFSGEGMTIPAADGGTECVPYGDFECVVEAADILLLVYGDRVTLLQKKDMTAGDIDFLRRLLTEKIAEYHSIF